MGTNYYARRDTCPHCQRGEEIHIGKSSFGWRFLFHIGRPWEDDIPRSVDEWREFLKREDVTVWDEYGHPQDKDQLWAFIEAKQDGRADPYPDSIFVDAQGFYCSFDEFC